MGVKSNVTIIAFSAPAGKVAEGRMGCGTMRGGLGLREYSFKPNTGEPAFRAPSVALRAPPSPLRGEGEAPSSHRQARADQRQRAGQDRAQDALGNA